MRLNAYLARAGIAARRRADELIKAGKVTVNGQIGRLNTKVSADDLVLVDDKRVKPQEFKYILLNKPSGVITTLKDTHSRPTVRDLVKVKENIVPVGRLDYDTTGALLLTNDGDLAYGLSHPKFAVDKVYEVRAEEKIPLAVLEKLKEGIRLADGLTKATSARLINRTTLELTIHTGRKRQVRRIMAALGIKLISLHRSAYGPLRLGSLKPGEWRQLNQSEIDHLQALRRPKK